MPDALAAPARFRDRCDRISIDRWRIDTLIPITESALLALLPEREIAWRTDPLSR